MKWDKFSCENKIVHINEVAQRLNTSTAKIRKCLEKISDDVIEFLQSEDSEPLVPRYSTLLNLT